MWVRPQYSSVAAGKTTFVAQNTGQVTHELMIERAPLKMDGPAEATSSSATSAATMPPASTSGSASRADTFPSDRRARRNDAPAVFQIVASAGPDKAVGLSVV